MDGRRNDGKSGAVSGWVGSDAWVADPWGPDDEVRPALTWYAPVSARSGRPRRRWPWLLTGFAAGVVTVPAVFLAGSASVSFMQTRSVDRQVRTELPQLEAFVERTRGLSFVRPVRVEVLAEDDFYDALDEGGDTDPVDVSGSDATAQALGEGANLSGRADGAFASGVDGFYDDQSHRLVVLGDVLDASTRQVIVHELTHALQDQHFDLGARAAEARSPEQQLAWRALVEGDATRVEQAWYDAQPGDVQDELDDVVGGEVEPAQDVVQDLFGFPYYAGPGLVRALLNSGGQAALDHAFTAPPVDTGQVLHPGRTPGRAVPDPGGLPTGMVVDRGELGELGLAHLLGRTATQPGPQAAWLGDRYATVQEELGPCTYDDLVVLSPADRAPLLVALQGWAQGRDGAAVTLAGPTALRLRSCSTD